MLCLTTMSDRLKKADMTHAKFIDSFRKIADFYEAHPECPLPDLKTLSLYPSKDHLATIVRAFGQCTKELDSEFGLYYVSHQVGSITLQAAFRREAVCNRVVTGTRPVVRSVPVKYEDIEEEVEIVRWDCPESLLEETPSA